MEIRSRRWLWVALAVAAVLVGATITSSVVLAQGMMPNQGDGPMTGTPGGAYWPYNMGAGMMGSQPFTGTTPFGPGMMGPGMGMGFGPGMMGMGPGMGMGIGMGFGPGMMGMMMGMGPGTMMGMMGMGEPELLGIPALSIEEAQEAAADFLAGFSQDGLVVGEVMVFDNHAYVQVIEEETGRGAFELLVDPVTLAVMPEPGPNMMWNQKYSPMAAMMGGMMGPFSAGQEPAAMMGEGMMGEGAGTEEAGLEMPVSPEEALQVAARFAELALNGAQVAEEATAFYGYYTVDILRDGAPVGMLSVNGYSRQVFVHHWHGDFLEMSSE